MKYGIGESLADFGFTFLEKIHRPIFLINRLGKIIKANKAGKKLIGVTHLSEKELESVGLQISNLFASTTSSTEACKRIRHISGLSFIARKFESMDYILVEVS